MEIPNSVRYFQRLNEMVKELASETKGEKMKLVKLDDVLELIDGSMADLESNYENSKLQEEIKRLPTVDAVEIIRCEDCKYYYGGMYCDYDIWAKPNGYCHFAEKREDDESKCPNCGQELEAWDVEIDEHHRLICPYCHARL